LKTIEDLPCGPDIEIRGQASFVSLEASEEMGCKSCRITDIRSFHIDRIGSKVRRKHGAVDAWILIG
jgi:hypothetical protein